MNNSSQSSPAIALRGALTVARVDFEILTATGGLIATLDDRNAAIARAKGLAETFPGVHVLEIQHFAPASRRVWKERPKLQLVRTA